MYTQILYTSYHDRACEMRYDEMVRMVLMALYACGGGTQSQSHTAPRVRRAVEYSTVALSPRIQKQHTVAGHQIEILQHKRARERESNNRKTNARPHIALYKYIQQHNRASQNKKKPHPRTPCIVCMNNLCGHVLGFCRRLWPHAF